MGHSGTRGRTVLAQLPLPLDRKVEEAGQEHGQGGVEQGRNRTRSGRSQEELNFFRVESTASP